MTQSVELEAIGAKARLGISLADVITLTKPRITTMVVTTTAGGLWLGARTLDANGTPIHVKALTVFFALFGTSLIVAGANALNMYIERDIDRRMDRTSNRPLPARRMDPRFALWFGVALSVVSIPILAIGVNSLTALLAVLANVSYVLAYTPMKQRSHHALLVGAVPGAMPPLLGWTAATSRIDAAGVVLFSILFLWQIPHFLAIAIFRREDYARAGLKVMPNTSGLRAVKHAIVRYSAALVASTLLVVPLGVAHHGYLAIAIVLGTGFFVWGCLGLRESAGSKWARWLFALSIPYLIAIFAALMIDPFS